MILTNGQTCLENIGLTHRPTLMAKNEYQKEEEYGVTHPNAISDGDGRGRGTEHGGHTHTTPDCSKASYIGEHFQSDMDVQIDTAITSGQTNKGAGDCVDIKTREHLFGINDYDPYENEYSARLVNTDVNFNDGQYRVETRDKMKIVC
jgi:hypothetical protein